jgi:type II secretory pathway pseudopilin PulG
MKKRTFTMLEMTCALALTAVLVIVFGSILSKLNQARDSFALETNAVLVIQNTIQRLKLEAEPTRDNARHIFLDEAKSVHTLEPRIAENENDMRLALLNNRKAIIVEVTLKCVK